MVIVRCEMCLSCYNVGSFTVNIYVVSSVVKMYVSKHTCMYGNTTKYAKIKYISKNIGGGVSFIS